MDTVIEKLRIVVILLSVLIGIIAIFGTIIMCQFIALEERFNIYLEKKNFNSNNTCGEDDEKDNVQN